MRRRAYVRILFAALALTLVATTIAPDVIVPFSPSPGESSSARHAASRLFEFIAWPPRVAARSAGIWIDSHSAQLWPPGWPMFTAFATRLALIAVPFWFVFGVVMFELTRVTSRVIRRSREK